ncbi:hypothetical protein, partial [Escherichia coli]|uniref:hypothetical protein n=1 Tax=Escherichia coli TaxID=562 RepID=UPI00195351D5
LRLLPSHSLELEVFHPVLANVAHAAHAAPGVVLPLFVEGLGAGLAAVFPVGLAEGGASLGSRLMRCYSVVA